MKLKLFLKVKFRVAKITLGTVERSWVFKVPEIAVLFADEIAKAIQFDERGVKLTAILSEG